MVPSNWANSYLLYIPDILMYGLWFRALRWILTIAIEVALLYTLFKDAILEPYLRSCWPNFREPTIHTHHTQHQEHIHMNHTIRYPMHCCNVSPLTIDEFEIRTPCGRPSLFPHDPSLLSIRLIHSCDIFQNESKISKHQSSSLEHYTSNDRDA